MQSAKGSLPGRTGSYLSFKRLPQTKRRTGETRLSKLRQKCEILDFLCVNHLPTLGSQGIRRGIFAIGWPASDPGLLELQSEHVELDESDVESSSEEITMNSFSSSSACSSLVTHGSSTSVGTTLIGAPKNSLLGASGRNTPVAICLISSCNFLTGSMHKSLAYKAELETVAETCLPKTDLVYSSNPNFELQLRTVALHE